MMKFDNFTKKLLGSFFFVGVLTACSGQDTIKITPEKKQANTLAVPNGHFIMPKLPTEMEFSGEKINLNDVDMRERLDKELHAIVFFHNLIIPYFKRANRYMGEIERMLKENDIPDDFKYLALIESGYENVESRSGAHGFWQFMPQTAKEYGLVIDDYIDERLDLKKSTKAATQYLKKAKDTLGSWLEAAASYNRGVGGLQKDQRWQSVDNYFDTYMNMETSRYVFRMMAVKLIFENPQRYGYEPSKMERYPVIETKTVLVSEVKNVALWAKEKGFNYKIVVKLNPWIKGNTLKEKTGEYSILLPKSDSQYSNYKEQ